MGKRLAFGLGIAALLWKVLSSYGDVDGRKAYLTDDTPSGWTSNDKTQIANRTTNIPAQQTITNLDYAILVMSFSGEAAQTISNSQSSVVNIFAKSGGEFNNYGSKTNDYSGGTYGCSFFLQVGQKGPNNNVPLESGALLQASLVLNGNEVYAVPLTNSVFPNGLYFPECTNLTGKVIAATNGGNDSDSDGLSDAVEKNITKTSSSNPDSDGDGYSDGQEYFLGSNPTSSNSVVNLVLNIGLTNGSCVVFCNGLSNVIYRTKRNFNLLNTDGWANVGETNLTYDGSQVIYTETNNHEKAFYKADADISKKVAE
jgi:hypothetical protein